MRKRPHAASGACLECGPKVFSLGGRAGNRKTTGPELRQRADRSGWVVILTAKDRGSIFASQLRTLWRPPTRHHPHAPTVSGMSSGDTASGTNCLKTCLVFEARFTWDLFCLMARDRAIPDFLASPVWTYRALSAGPASG